ASVLRRSFALMRSWSQDFRSAANSVRRCSVVSITGFRRRQLAWVFCRRDVWHSGFPQACWRRPTRGFGRKPPAANRTRSLPGLWHGDASWSPRVGTDGSAVQIRMPGSVLESTGGSILASAEAQNCLAHPFAVLLPPRVRHLYAQLIHPLEEFLRLIHPHLQPALANQHGGFHQRSRRVS